VLKFSKVTHLETFIKLEGHKQGTIAD